MAASYEEHCRLSPQGRKIVGGKATLRARMSLTADNMFMQVINTTQVRNTLDFFLSHKHEYVNSVSVKLLKNTNKVGTKGEEAKKWDKNGDKVGQRSEKVEQEWAQNGNGTRSQKAGQEGEESGNKKPKSGTRMGTKWEQEAKKWDKNGNKVGTRTPKVGQE